MKPSRSRKFWILFWGCSALLLSLWFLFLEVRNGNLKWFDAPVRALPLAEETRNDMRALLSVADFVLKKDGITRTYLVLFQNNYELRPGGGFIGSFGIVKIRNGELLDFSVHDTGNFDGRIPSTVEPPYPMREMLHVDSWKLRDSNFSPDFPTNARQAEIFYRMGNGEETFDGVIGITTDVLVSFLSVTGPVEVPGYPGTYGGESAVWDLEYQVEVGFLEQGIERGERKSMMNELGFQILNEVKTLDMSGRWKLIEVILRDLHAKDIQVAFDDPGVSNKIREAGWDGSVLHNWKGDALLAVDANLGAWKSDYFVKRSYEYVLDFSKEKPTATFSVTYLHTAEKKDWRTGNYQSFFRLYVPKGSWLVSSEGFVSEPVFGEEVGRETFGARVFVPMGSEKTVSYTYTLPSSITPDFYELLIEKQPGVHDIPMSVTLLRKGGSMLKKDFVLDRDVTMDARGEVLPRSGS
ncbi:MAG: DUF4012 domain-containing protein [Candidatus Moraniibacteriota bacterium]|nr:MAG: DUF4012 domain-containing protein [Candidatus Moranbacteria bacterium]